MPVLLSVALLSLQVPTGRPPSSTAPRSPAVLELFPPGVAFGSTVASDGERLVLKVPETAQGVDLNGDGDLADRVLHVADVASGNIANVGFEASQYPNRGLFGGQFPFEGRESENGDLNGDGDLLDSEAMVYDGNTGVLHRAGVRGTPYATGGQHVLLAVREKPGEDLNGDGDAHDIVLFHWDLSSGVVQDLDLTPWAYPVASVSTFLFQLAETDTGDRNGDGDAADLVLHVLDLEHDAMINTGLAAAEYAAGGGLEAILVSESDQGGQDLTGDGDAADAALFVFDVASATLRNLHTVVRKPVFFPNVESVAFQLAHRRIAYIVPEESDLNGDADALDEVLFVHTFATNQTRNLGSATFRYDLGANYLAFEVDEHAQGNGPLNGDGDGVGQRGGGGQGG